MKRPVCLLLLLFCLAAWSPVPCLGEGLAFPERPDAYAPALAEAALRLSAGYTAGDQKRLSEEAGFEVLCQKHFDKAPSAPAHTCAYTIAARPAGEDGGRFYLILVRGTAGGEWYSNFDIAPDRDAEAPFAGNFLFCAEEIFLEFLSLAENTPASRVLLCGHSRGAACANLLAVLLNAAWGPERVCAYTSATPATVRARAKAGIGDANIFNLINPCDLVPRLPPAAWGFTRFGTDVFPESEADPAALSALEELEAVLERIAPTVRDYYGTRHSLTGPGTDPGGLTAFELMLGVSDTLIGLTAADAPEPVPGGAVLPAGSDFAPLLPLLERDSAAGLLLEHLPERYLALFFGASSH